MARSVKALVAAFVMAAACGIGDKPAQVESRAELSANLPEDPAKHKKCPDGSVLCGGVCCDIADGAACAGGSICCWPPRCPY